MSETRARLLLMLVGSLVGIFLSEALLRLIRPPQLGITLQPCIYVRDETIGYLHQPGASGLKTRDFEIENVVRINAWGFHDVEPENREDNPFPVVAVFGDSFTAALEVDVSRGWTQVMERELRRRGHQRAAVYNFGLNGTGTNIQLALLKRYLPYLRPDLVLLAFYRNDIKDVTSPKVYKECYRGYVLTYVSEEQRRLSRDYVDHNWPGPLSSWLYQRSFMFRAVSLLGRHGVLLQCNNLNPSRLGIPGSGSGGKGRRPGAALKQAFRGFHRLSREHGFRFLVLPVPTKASVSSSIEAFDNHVPPGIRSELAVLNTAPVLKRREAEAGLAAHEELYWSNDGHFNELGNRLFGEAAAELLAPELARLGATPDTPSGP